MMLFTFLRELREENRAVGFLMQTYEGFAEGRFYAARLPHNPNHFSRIHLEADIIHCLQESGSETDTSRLR